VATSRTARAPVGAPSQDDGALLLALLRLADLAARPFHERAGRGRGIGLSEWRVLAALHDRPGSTATDVARLTGLDKMGVSRALASLEADGRVERRPDPDDGRRALVALTPAGRQLHRSLRAQVRACEQSVVASLSGTDRRRLAAMLERMSSTALDAQDGASAAR
jgi:DNA-binding MarR family transcriptional regulator